MDIHNNEIGFAIGATAQSFEEIVQRAQSIVSASDPFGRGVLRKANGLSGDGGLPAAKWLPESEWKRNPRYDDGPQAGTEMPTAETNWWSNPKYSKTGPNWVDGTKDDGKISEYQYGGPTFSSSGVLPDSIALIVASAYTGAIALEDLVNWVGGISEDELEAQADDTDANNEYYVGPPPGESEEQTSPQPKEVEAQTDQQPEEVEAQTSQQPDAAPTPIQPLLPPSRYEDLLREEGGIEGPGTLGRDANDSLRGEEPSLSRTLMDMGRSGDRVEAVLEKSPDQATVDEARLVAKSAFYPGAMNDDPARYRRNMAWLTAWGRAYPGDYGVETGGTRGETDGRRIPPLWSSAARSRDGHALDKGVQRVGNTVDRMVAVSGRKQATLALQSGLNAIQRATHIQAAQRGSQAIDPTVREQLARYANPDVRNVMPEALYEDGELGPKTGQAARRLVASLGDAPVRQAVVDAASRLGLAPQRAALGGSSGNPVELTASNRAAPVEAPGSLAVSPVDEATRQQADPFSESRDGIQDVL